MLHSPFALLGTMMGFGASFPYNGPSGEIIRIGLYALEPNGIRLIYAMATEDRVPGFKESVFQRSSGQCEVAAVNWALGGLCGYDKSPGIFTLKHDVKLPDKSRTVFGSRRTWQAAVQMFDDHLAGEPVKGGMKKMAAPVIFPVVTRQQAVSALGGNVDELEKVGTVYRMSRNELQNHIRNLLNSAISCARGGRGGQSQSAIASFRSQMIRELAFKFSQVRRDQDEPFWHRIRQELSDWGAQLDKQIPFGLEIPDVVVDSKRMMSVIGRIQEAFRIFLDMGPDGTIEVVCPTNYAGSSASQESSQAFRDPMFHAVCVQPVQIAEGMEIANGYLPDDGGSLFAPVGSRAASHQGGGRNHGARK